MEGLLLIPMLAGLGLIANKFGDGVATGVWIGAGVMWFVGMIIMQVTQ